MVLSPGVYGQKAGGNETPSTVPELRKAILKVLEDTGTPAAGIAMVDKEGVWIEGLEMADQEKGIAADEKTMFRIASTSKIFVALSILKLQEQGKVSLKDKIRYLIPEIEFHNAWEDTNPILIEHLLEHTTGWDDIHVAESAYNSPEIKSLNEGLYFHPHSRISKWAPGTRMAYSNSGPAVAAYIVEVITGQTFEDYIQENFFAPLGMETKTYFLSKEYIKKGDTLYNDGYPAKISASDYAPSGAINASPKDMAKMLHFLIKRGSDGSSQLLSESSIKRMETPSTTLGAKAGLKYGYGLGLYTSDHNGFTYYKHGGDIRGGNSDFSYMPEFCVGYSVQINAGKTEAIRTVSTLIRNYQTRHLPKTEKKIPSLKSRNIPYSLDGYYQSINPVKSLPFYLPPLMAERIWSKGDTIYNQLPALFGKIVKFVAVDKGIYHNLHTGRIDFFVVKDPLYGDVLEMAGTEGGTITLGSVPGALVFGRIVVLMLWVIFIFRAFVLLPFWCYHYWRGRIPPGAHLFIRIWPLLPIVILMLVLVLLAVASMGEKNL